MLKLINSPLLNSARLYSSKRWLTRQNNDHFVKLAKESDFRARSCFKLIEILDKYNSDFEKLKQIPDGANVLDLGCAPGSWCQVIKQRFPKANVVGVDLLDCTPLQNVKLLKGDFTTFEAQQEILKEFDGKEIDLVVSDMAPSFSGNSTADHYHSVHLTELVLEFTSSHLKNNGHLIFKFLMGGSHQEIMLDLRKRFKKVINFKPKSSRKESREIFFICLNKI